MSLERKRELKNTIVFKNHNSRTKFNWKGFWKQIGKQISTLELTKERFLNL